MDRTVSRYLHVDKLTLHSGGTSHITSDITTIKISISKNFPSNCQMIPTCKEPPTVPAPMMVNYYSTIIICWSHPNLLQVYCRYKAFSSILFMYCSHMVRPFLSIWKTTPESWFKVFRMRTGSSMFKKINNKYLYSSQVQAHP